MAQETTQYEQEVTHCQQGERVLTAVDGCTIVQTADGAVAVTADARIALGPATHAAACWRDEGDACAVALTDEEGSPRHRVAFLTTKGLVDTVECGPRRAVSTSRARPSARATRARRALRRRRCAWPSRPRRRRVVERRPACRRPPRAARRSPSSAIASRWARRTELRRRQGAAAPSRPAAIARDLDLPASEAGEPVTALAATDRWLFVAAGRALRW